MTRTGLCQLDTGSEADMEAAIDPLLCNYQGPVGSLLRSDNVYYNEPSDVFSGWFNQIQIWRETSRSILTVFMSSGCPVSQRPVCGGLTTSKRRDYFTSEHFDACSSAFLMSLPVSGPFPQHSERRPSIEEVEVSDCGVPPDRPPPYNTFMGTLLLTRNVNFFHCLCGCQPFSSHLYFRNVWESSLETSAGSRLQSQRDNSAWRPLRCPRYWLGPGQQRRQGCVLWADEQRLRAAVWQLQDWQHLTAQDEHLAESSCSLPSWRGQPNPRNLSTSLNGLLCNKASMSECKGHQCVNMRSSIAAAGDQWKPLFL